MRTETYIQYLLDKKRIPGINILVGKNGRIKYSKSFGYSSVMPDKTALRTDAIYDTASLTKPLITAYLIVYLIEKKELKPDTLIYQLFPGFNKDISISHLLTHRSGIIPWFPFYLFPDQDPVKLLSEQNLISKPGRRVNYSCPGYILLFQVINKIYKKGFVHLANQVLFSKLNLHNTYLSVPKDKKPLTVPTELGNKYERRMAASKFNDIAENYNWRTALIQGETHDVNSHYFGGTAGNSGLFSNAEDLFSITSEFFPLTATILNPESIKLFWKNFTPFKKSHRSFGFKINSSLISSGGSSLSSKAIGHNGFTGTSIWLEAKTGLTFILLSNRIHPAVDQSFNFNRVRRIIHRKLKQDLGL